MLTKHQIGRSFISNLKPCKILYIVGVAMLRFPLSLVCSISMSVRAGRGQGPGPELGPGPEPGQEPGPGGGYKLLPDIMCPWKKFRLIELFFKKYSNTTG